VSWAIIAFCGLVALSVGGSTTGAWGRRRAKANAERMQADAADAGADDRPTPSPREEPEDDALAVSRE
jgi:hypothetical protein